MEIIKKYEDILFSCAEIQDIVPWWGGFITCSGTRSMQLWIDDSPSTIDTKECIGVRCLGLWEDDLVWGSGHDICVMTSELQHYRILKGHTDVVVSLSTWREYLCSSSADFTIRLWTKNGACAFWLFGHTDMVFEMLILQDTLYSVSGDCKIFHWSFEELIDNKVAPVQKGQLLGHRNTVFCICEWNGRIATGSRDQKIGIWSTKGVFIKFLKGHNDAVKKLVSYEYRLISGSADGTICVWNANLKLIQSTWLGWDGVSAIRVVDHKVLVGCSDGSLVEMQGNEIIILMLTKEAKKPWRSIRLLWIGKRKNGSECLLSSLPIDMIRTIIEFL